MKQLKVSLILLLLLLVSGCTNLDSPSKITQHKKDSNDIVEKFNIDLSKTTGEIILYDLNLNEAYKKINFTIYSFENSKWEVVYNRDWELKGTSAYLSLENSESKGITMSLNSNDMNQIENIHQFPKESYKEYTNTYDVVEKSDMNVNVPFSLIAYYRDYNNDSIKEVSLKDIHQPEDIILNDKDEYYIVTATIKH